MTTTQHVNGLLLQCLRMTHLTLFDTYLTGQKLEDQYCAKSDALSLWKTA